MGVRGGAGLGRPAGAALSPALSVQGASSMAIAMLFGSQLVLMSVDDPLKTEPEDQRMTPYGHCLWHRARRCIMDVALRLACCTVRVYAYTWYARCWVAWHGSTEHCECQMHAATRLETSHSTLSRRGSDRMCRRFPAPPRPGPLPKPCTPPLHAFASAVQYAPRRVCKWTINSMLPPLPPLRSRGSRTTWTCRLASARSKTATRSRTSVTSCCPVRAALRAPQSCCQQRSAVLRRVPSLSDHSACNLLRCADRLSPCASEYPEYAGTRCSICLSASRTDSRAVSRLTDHSLTWSQARNSGIRFGGKQYPLALANRIGATGGRWQDRQGPASSEHRACGYVHPSCRFVRMLCCAEYSCGLHVGAVIAVVACMLHAALCVLHAVWCILYGCMVTLACCIGWQDDELRRLAGCDVCRDRREAEGQGRPQAGTAECYVARGIYDATCANNRQQQ